jgi:hypothetical protein
MNFSYPFNSLNSQVQGLAFGTRSQGAAWTAVFALLLLYLLTYFPRLWIGAFKRDVEEDSVKETKVYRSNSKARDGLLVLTSGVAMSFAAKATEGAIVALSWIFFALWVLVVGLNYFIDSKMIIVSLELVGISIVVAIMIVARATSNVLF